MDFCLIRLLLVTCLISSAISANHRRSHFDKLRVGNCMSCRENLQRNVAEVLPRLSLIKQKIMNALGKNVDDESNGRTTEESQKSNLVKKLPDTAARPRTYGLNEIVSVSQPANQANDTVLRFHIRKHSVDGNSEAVGASLLLFLDRKRRIRKGRKGKKIFIEISTKLDTVEKEQWKVLAFFRTRVKKRRWKSISLPLSVAQRLLEPDINSVDLRVKCFGCGRLVDLVLDKDRGRTRKVKVGKKGKVKRQSSKSKVKHKTMRRHPRKRANPILIISTKYKIS